MGWGRRRIMVIIITIIIIITQLDTTLTTTMTRTETEVNEHDHDHGDNNLTRGGSMISDQLIAFRARTRVLCVCVCVSNQWRLPPGSRAAARPLAAATWGRGRTEQAHALLLLFILLLLLALHLIKNGVWLHFWYNKLLSLSVLLLFRATTKWRKRYITWCESNTATSHTKLHFSIPSLLPFPFQSNPIQQCPWMRTVRSELDWPAQITLWS